MSFKKPKMANIVENIPWTFLGVVEGEIVCNCGKKESGAYCFKNELTEIKVGSECVKKFKIMQKFLKQCESCSRTILPHEYNDGKCVNCFTGIVINKACCDCGSIISKESNHECNPITNGGYYIKGENRQLDCQNNYSLYTSESCSFVWSSGLIEILMDGHHVRFDRYHPYSSWKNRILQSNLNLEVQNSVVASDGSWIETNGVREYKCETCENFISPIGKCSLCKEALELRRRKS